MVLLDTFIFHYIFFELCILKTEGEIKRCRGVKITFTLTYTLKLNENKRVCFNLFNVKGLSYLDVAISEWKVLFSSIFYGLQLRRTLERLPL